MTTQTYTSWIKQLARINYCDIDWGLIVASTDYNPNTNNDQLLLTDSKSIEQNNLFQYDEHYCTKYGQNIYIVMSNEVNVSVHKKLIMPYKIKLDEYKLTRITNTYYIFTSDKKIIFMWQNQKSKEFGSESSDTVNLSLISYTFDVKEVELKQIKTIEFFGAILLYNSGQIFKLLNPKVDTETKIQDYEMIYSVTNHSDKKNKYFILWYENKTIVKNIITNETITIQLGSSLSKKKLYTTNWKILIMAYEKSIVILNLLSLEYMIIDNVIMNWNCVIISKYHVFGRNELNIQVLKMLQ